MGQTINLSEEIGKQLPSELVEFTREAGRVASGYGENLYLVGGVVRDLLLGRSNFDLDLVVEGDAIALAQRLMQGKIGKITTYPHFRTAKLQWNKLSIDLTTARSETYARPGALPIVASGSLSSDLFRRDFTINAMAINLHPAHYGDLVDLYGGRDDLEHKLIRILHEKSFIDDATRIWRALRYEQRLDFRIEPTTLRLLKRDLPMLDTVSGDRIRYELECVLQEEQPEKALRRAGELTALQKMHPALKGNGWLAEKFELARELSSTTPPPIALYLGLLCYHLVSKEIEELISYLRLPKSLAQVLRDIVEVKGKLEKLAQAGLPPSHIYRFLHGLSPLAITTASLASSSPTAQQHLQLFLSRLRYIRPALTGEELKGLGVTPGPQIKELLQMLREARLDGEVTSKRGEIKLVEKWLAGKAEGA